VYYQGRDQKAAAEITSVTEGLGNRATFVEGELYDYDSISALIDFVVERHGRLDGAVGSGASRVAVTRAPEALGASFKSFRTMTAADIEIPIKSGFLPRAFLAHAASQKMAEQRYGKIVLVTTDAGRVPTPGESMIGASAAALVFLTRALGREFARDGVRINTVGITLTTGTPAYEQHVERMARDVESERLQVKVFQKLESRMPFGLGSADEIAELIAFLVAPESDGITGATLSVNRGAYFPTY
jgi:3-oxoacyl-[acyl-carrier protein] reductase